MPKSEAQPKQTRKRRIVKHKGGIMDREQRADATIAPHEQFSFIPAYAITIGESPPSLTDWRVRIEDVLRFQARITYQKVMDEISRDLRRVLKEAGDLRDLEKDTGELLAKWEAGNG